MDNVGEIGAIHRIRSAMCIVYGQSVTIFNLDNSLMGDRRVGKRK